MLLKRESWRWMSLIAPDICTIPLCLSAQPAGHSDTTRHPPSADCTVFVCVCVLFMNNYSARCRYEPDKAPPQADNTRDSFHLSATSFPPDLADGRATCSCLNLIPGPPPKQPLNYRDYGGQDLLFFSWFKFLHFAELKNSNRSFPPCGSFCTLCLKLLWFGEGRRTVAVLCRSWRSAVLFWPSGGFQTLWHPPVLTPEGAVLYCILQFSRSVARSLRNFEVFPWSWLSREPWL